MTKHTTSTPPSTDPYHEFGNRERWLWRAGDWVESALFSSLIAAGTIALVASALSDRENYVVTGVKLAFATVPTAAAAFAAAAVKRRSGQTEQSLTLNEQIARTVRRALNESQLNPQQQHNTKPRSV